MLITWLLTLRQTPDTSTVIEIVRDNATQVAQRDGSGLTVSESDQAEELNGQFMDVLTRSKFSGVPPR